MEGNFAQNTDDGTANCHLPSYIMTVSDCILELSVFRRSGVEEGTAV